jgi:hypothetical protein
MAVIHTLVNVRNSAAKKRIKQIAEEKDRKLEEDRKNFSAISSIVKKKGLLKRKKHTR